MKHHPQRKDPKLAVSLRQEGIKIILQEEDQHILPFLETLPRAQRESIEVFKRNVSDNAIDPTLSEVFSSLGSSSEIDNYRSCFFKALRNIRSYADFLKRYPPDKSPNAEIYNYKTAPYFFYAFRASKDPRSKFIFDIQKLINEVSEYSLYILETILTEREFSLQLRTVFYLFHKKKNTISEVSRKLNITPKSINAYLREIDEIAIEMTPSIERLTIEFLKYSPIERKTIVFTFRGYSYEQIALKLKTTKATVLEARHTTAISKNPAFIRHSYKEHDFNNLNLEAIDPQYSRFLPKHGLLIHLSKIEDLASLSEYGPILHMLIAIGRKDLVQLYFLLMEIPSVEVISKISNYKKEYLFKKCKELKKYLGVETAHRMSDWVEITKLGKMFLTYEIDYEILKSIIRLKKIGTKISSSRLKALFPLYTKDNIINRLSSLRRLFNIPNGIKYDQFPEYILGEAEVNRLANLIDTEQ